MVELSILFSYDVCNYMFILFTDPGQGLAPGHVTGTGTGIGAAGEGGPGLVAGQPAALEAEVGQTVGHEAGVGHLAEGQGPQSQGQGHLRKMKLGERKRKQGERQKIRRTDDGG